MRRYLIQALDVSIIEDVEKLTADTVRHFGMKLQRILPLLILLLVPQGVWAHAIVLKSSPAVDAVLSGDDLPIRLRFNSRIDRARSKMMLFAPDGTQQSLAPAAESPADGLNAEAKALAPGTWHLRWQVLSVDGHITRGDIPFTVR
jgi:hypothetical protein